MVAQQATFAEV